jgi:hypothetical protein
MKVDPDVSCLYMLPQDGKKAWASMWQWVMSQDESTSSWHVETYLQTMPQCQSSLSLWWSPSHCCNKKETLLVTGHSDGTMLVHHILETIHRKPSLLITIIIPWL